jgi:hypothetical protein
VSDVTWFDTDQGIRLVVGGAAGEHVRAATDLEIALAAENVWLREALIGLVPLVKSVRDGFSKYGDERVDDLLVAVEEAAALAAAGTGAAPEEER